MPPNPTASIVDIRLQKATCSAAAWALAGVMLVALPRAGHADGQQCLAEIEAKLSRTYSELSQLPPEHLLARLGTPERPLLIDARKQEEFRVGHIEGAIRIDPDMPADAAVQSLSSLAAGRDVVIYCSVGYRSSRLAHRIGVPLRQAGARSVSNLMGGLFGWHNRGLPVINVSGPTDELHPYSRRWQRFLDFDNLTVGTAATSSRR